jgi:hypothetical protein
MDSDDHAFSIAEELRIGAAGSSCSQAIERSFRPDSVLGRPDPVALLPPERDLVSCKQGNQLADPVYVGGIITGLTPGTAYWFDIVLQQGPRRALPVRRWSSKVD